MFCVLFPRHFQCNLGKWLCIKEEWREDMYTHFCYENTSLVIHTHASAQILNFWLRASQQNVVCLPFPCYFGLLPLWPIFAHLFQATFCTNNKFIWAVYSQRLCLAEEFSVFESSSFSTITSCLLSMPICLICLFHPYSQPVRMCDCSSNLSLAMNC